MVVASRKRVGSNPTSKAEAGGEQCVAAVPPDSDAFNSPGRVNEEKAEQEEVSPGKRPGQRRQSARIQTIQREKELLAQRERERLAEREKKRLLQCPAELLGEEENGRAKKRVKVRRRVVTDCVENGSNAVPDEEQRQPDASAGEEKDNAAGEKSDYVKVKETLFERLLVGRVEDENEAPAGGANLPNGTQKSDYAMVKETLRLFNKHYLHFVQVCLSMHISNLFVTSLCARCDVVPVGSG